MAIKKDAPVQKLDAAVEAALDPLYDELAEARKRARNMTPAQRKKLQKDAQRNRAMFDLPDYLMRIIDQIAEENSCPKSQVAAYLMVAGLHAMDNNIITGPGWNRKISKSMRYDYTLVLPQVPDRWKGE